MTKLALLLIPLLLITACSENIHSNKNLRNVSSHQDVSQMIHKGMTKEQVRKSLGEPNNTMVMNNQTMWLYRYRKRNLNTAGKVLDSIVNRNFAHKQKILMIYFDDAGIVTSFQYREENT